MPINKRQIVLTAGFMGWANYQIHCTPTKETILMRDSNQDNWVKGCQIAGRWEIRNVLRGGMGIVYVISDIKEHYLLAAKTFKRFLIHTEKALNRFQQEAEIHINLGSHRNIVQAINFQYVNNVPLIFLKYISSGNLKLKINEGKLSFKQALTFALEICYGMEYANENGVIAHRDIKPANILIDKDPITNEDVPKISDFGISHVLNDAIFDESFTYDAMALNMNQLQIDSSLRGKVAGTPAYMAPEQFQNITLHVSADIYSFGIMLYEMLTGKLPFVAHSWNEYAHVHQKKAPPSLKKILPAKGLMIDEIVQKCLNKYPEKRFKSFADLREQLMMAFKKITGEDARKQVTDKKLIWLHQKGMEEFERRHKSGEGEASRRELYKKMTGKEMPEDLLHQPIQFPDFLERLKKVKEAMDASYKKHFGESLPLFPQKVLTGSEWVNKAGSYVNLNLPEKALHCCERALSIDPQDKNAWNNKGVSYDLMGKFVDAIRCFDNAIQIDRNYLHPRVGKGSVLIALRKYDEALDCFNFVIKKEPTFPRVLFLKGLALDETGDYEEALAFYDKALALNPLSPEVWCNRANTLGRLNKLTESIKSYKRAVELDPSMLAAWGNMANTYRELKMYEEALDCYNHTIQIAPSDPKLHLGKGLILFLTERYEEALICYKEAARIGSPVAWDAITQCLEKLNRQY